MANKYDIPNKSETLVKHEPKRYEILTDKYLMKPVVVKYHRFGCYQTYSPDSRCCGLCYCCCRAKSNDKTLDTKRCDFCPNDLCEYWYSGYVQTTEGRGNSEEEINGCCCWLCFPLKFPLFFPCFLGSLCNHAINICCATTCWATITTGCPFFSGCAAPIKRNYLC
jgi:hypothetical protein